MDIKEVLISLSSSVAIGDIDEACILAKDILKEYCPVFDCNDLGFYGKFDAKSDKTIMIEAHIDEVGMIVTHIDDNGFLSVSNCGGIDVKTLPSAQVVVHGKEKVKGVFCSTPPHLSKENATYDNISDIKIDTGLKEKAKELISIGDFVTYDVKASALIDSRVTSKSLDDRAGCTVLLELAGRLYGKDLPVNVVLLFSDKEELGMRGVRTAAYSLDIDEAIAVDVSFASAPGVPEDKSGKLSDGAMIGVSPVLSSKISKKLLALAKENGIAYQCEVMGGSTGTDADALSVMKEGIPCGLISVPLRNMHSAVEVVDTKDIVCTADLLEKYILDGGAVN